MDCRRGNPVRISWCGSRYPVYGEGRGNGAFDDRGSAAVPRVGVCICMLGTKLTWKERVFCIIAYLPKATVQAAIGSVPLAAGLSCGTLVLSVAVMAIVITAPIGAFGIDSTYKHLLEKE